MEVIKLRLVSTSRYALAHRQLVLSSVAWDSRPLHAKPRFYATASPQPNASDPDSSSPQTPSNGSSRSSSPPSPTSTSASENQSSTSDLSMPPGWEDQTSSSISKFSELPNQHFGFNQHMLINAEFKEALRQVLWKFRAPIRYAFAYGSGVFPQSSPAKSPAAESPHPHPPEAVVKWQTSGGKSIDFIFGVSFTQHWHSINLQEHRDHYSLLGSLGSAAVSRVQDNIGAGGYFHPYIVIDGIMLKYGVVNLDTLFRDLSEWETLYWAGRLHKPVKILRDDARIRYANQVNLISAVRTALLMLPETFTERDLYMKIASISYMGDPRMAMRAENPRKVANIVDNQMTQFRQLYLPLIQDLPNIHFNDSETTTSGWLDNPETNSKLEQDMQPQRRGNMVQRLPKMFRKRLYTHYQGIFQIPGREFNELMEQKNDDTKTQGGSFDQRIAEDKGLQDAVVKVVKQTINWPSLTQSVKAIMTAGIGRSWRYFRDKREKGRKLQKTEKEIEPQKDIEKPAGSKENTQKDESGKKATK